MNQIHAKDWAEDDWGWHSGMDSNPYDAGNGHDSDRVADTGDGDHEAETNP